jgi:hypothetical protein
MALKAFVSALTLSAQAEQGTFEQTSPSGGAMRKKMPGIILSRFRGKASS